MPNARSHSSYPSYCFDILSMLEKAQEPLLTFPSKRQAERTRFMMYNYYKALEREMEKLMKLVSTSKNSDPMRKKWLDDHTYYEGRLRAARGFAMQVYPTSPSATGEDDPHTLAFRFRESVGAGKVLADAMMNIQFHQQESPEDLLRLIEEAEKKGTLKIEGTVTRTSPDPFKHLGSDLQSHSPLGGEGSHVQSQKRHKNDPRPTSLQHRASLLNVDTAPIGRDGKPIRGLMPSVTVTSTDTATETEEAPQGADGSEVGSDETSS